MNSIVSPLKLMILTMWAFLGNGLMFTPVSGLCFMRLSKLVGHDDDEDHFLIHHAVWADNLLLFASENSVTLCVVVSLSE